MSEVPLYGRVNEPTRHLRDMYLLGLGAALEHFLAAFLRLPQQSHFGEHLIPTEVANLISNRANKANSIRNLESSIRNL